MITLLVWDIIRKVTFRIQPSARYYYLKHLYLLEQKKEKEAYELLVSGADYYHKDYRLNLNAALYYKKIKKWSDSLKYWRRLYHHNLLKKEKDYINYVAVLRNTSSKLECIKILESGLRKFPESISIHESIFNFNVYLMKWNNVIEIYDMMKKKKLNISKSIKIKRAMLYQIYGDYENAKKIYKVVFNEESSNEHTKIVLFDNNESSIEFYKRHEKVEQVCLTFDSINIQKVHEPFGFQFLKKEKLDVIALRRRRKNSYHQDLLVSEYYKIVNKPTGFYKRKIAYGFSLGGYTSLYYGSSVDADILSISPRNSTHPFYGINQENKELFKHEIVQKRNGNITPIILYDPKNNVDKKYVEEELIVLYPNAKLVKCPYAGHRIAPYLLQIGALKDVVKSVIDDDEFPDLKLYNKRESSQYLRILSEICYMRDKYKLARDISDLGLKINNTDLRLIKVYILSLIKLDSEETAFKWLDENIKNKSDNWLKHMHYLLDIKLNSKKFNISIEDINLAINGMHL